MTDPTAARKSIDGVIEEAKSIYDRYAAHGRIDGKRAIVVVHGDSMPADSPVALGFSQTNTCALVGITDDYTNAAAVLGRPELMNTQGMKAFLVAHEDMHCRIDTTPMDSVGNGSPAAANVPLLERFDALVNESISDSMAVLVTARRDGAEASTKLIDQLTEFRQGSALDREHDTRATLALLRDDIQSPARYSNDEAAFKTAITTGLKGATDTFQRQLSADEKFITGTKDFSDLLSSQERRLTGALNTYRTGPDAAYPNVIQSLDGAVVKQYNASDYPLGPRPSSDANEKELNRFGEQIKEIMGGMKPTAENTMGGNENPYMRGRNMDPSMSAPSMTIPLVDRPSSGMRL